MTPASVRLATQLLEHKLLRRGELCQLQEIGTTMHAVVLHLNGGTRININLRDDIADTETMRVEIIDMLTVQLRMSISATNDHLALLGVTEE